MGQYLHVVEQVWLISEIGTPITDCEIRQDSKMQVVTDEGVEMAFSA